jgi:hypothetical protein
VKTWANLLKLIPAKTDSHDFWMTYALRGLDDHYGVQNIRCDPIDAGKNQTIESVESEPLWRFPSQHIELVAQP